jgi:glycosyltransferase involved in cell wall biosynthesis
MDAAREPVVRERGTTMHVCMVTSAPIPPEEGVGHYVWNLAQQLIRKGHAAEIITRGKPGPSVRERLGQVTVWRPAFAPLYPFHVHLHSLFVNRLVARLEGQVDVYHVHTPLPPVLRTHRPVLLTVHTPMRADARAVPLRDLSSFLIKLQLPVSSRLERGLLRSATRVTAVATSVADELHEYGVDPAQVAVLGNGVDHQRVAPGHTRAGGPPYILAVGRLDQRKGFQDLVACAQSVCQRDSQVQFWIAGKGPMEATLSAAIERAGLEDRVRLLGFVADRAELVRLYQEATVFAHPAHREGLPTVLLEAMACGTPVVSTAVSGALDVIRSSENGMLVPPQKPEAMAEALVALLGDPSLRDRLGHSARQTIERHYSWDAISERYVACYEQLLSSCRCRSGRLDTPHPPL